METITPARYKNFLKQLDLENIKTTYIKITVMSMSEKPIESIEGRVTTGSINISASSSIRRTCNLTFVADEEEYNYTEVSGLLSMNKKISISVGIENTINNELPDKIWFKQGIFIINNVSLSHTSQGVQISLQCKDKMCLLNGECGGGLPTSITFHEYDQVLESGEIVTMPQLIYDIIQTLVVRWGGENESNVFINDVPKQIKQLMRWVGKNELYYDTISKNFTTNVEQAVGAGWRVFNYNEDIGYTYTDFTYPGELVSNIGDNVCSVLDTIVSTLGNYEYFYDVDGHFVFQEIKNYLNNSYTPGSDTLGSEYRLNEDGEVIKMDWNNISIINDKNYMVDFNSNSKSVYTFNENNGLISSYTNTPNYANMKNDYHIWGKNSDGNAIHYHVAIKNKPTIFNKYFVEFLKDDNDKFNGKIKYLMSYIDDENFTIETDEETGDNILVIPDIKKYKVQTGPDGETTLICTRDAKISDKENEKEILWLTERAKDNAYIPTDWRAELYLQGAMKQANQQRPDIYEQELLDLFPDIYDFYEPWVDEDGNPIYFDEEIVGEGVKIQKRGKFRSDIVNRPNSLNYFIDFLEPKNKYEDCSIDSINQRIYSFQQDKIKRLYDSYVPNVIILNAGAVTEEEIDEYQKIKTKCLEEGQTYVNVPANIYNGIAIGTNGYSAQESLRELLYQYTNMNEQINIQTVPIYYLDVNSRITVQDNASEIFGDYIIQSISVPLTHNGQMNINASRALERI